MHQKSVGIEGAFDGYSVNSQSKFHSGSLDGIYSGKEKEVEFSLGSSLSEEEP